MKNSSHSSSLYGSMHTTAYFVPFDSGKEILLAEIVSGYIAPLSSPQQSYPAKYSSYSLAHSLDVFLTNLTISPTYSLLSSSAN